MASRERRAVVSWELFWQRSGKDLHHIELKQTPSVLAELIGLWCPKVYSTVGIYSVHVTSIVNLPIPIEGISPCCFWSRGPFHFPVKDGSTSSECHNTNF